MLRPCEMELINIAVLKEDAEQTFAQLLKLGNFHPVDIRQIESGLDGISASEIQREAEDWEKLAARLRQICAAIDYRPFSGPAVVTPMSAVQFSYAFIDQKLNSIGAAAAPHIAKKDELEGEIRTRMSMLDRVPGVLPVSLKKRDNAYSFLEVISGRIADKNLELLERSLSGIHTVIYPFRKEPDGRVALLLIGLRRDRAYLRKVMADAGLEKTDFTDEENTVTGEIQLKIKLQIEKDRQESALESAALADIAARSGDELSQMNTFIRLKKSIMEARKYSCITDKTVLLSGWVPAGEKDGVVSRIRQMESCVYVEERRPEELGISKDDVPVLLKHSPFIKPFELLIESYGIPRYGSVDPTLFTAITFLLMFGAMFGDLGHGLLLFTAGMLIMRSRNEKVRQAGALTSYAGGVSALFGLLYGSAFGLEFDSLWVKPINNILGVFKMSIIFGIAVISLGVALNVFISLRDRNYAKAFFDKAGLISGILYWSGIALAVRLTAPGAGAVPAGYFILISACFVILFLKPLLEIFTGKAKEGVFVLLMETVIDMMEIVMGYLANTVSFIRVAAFALAHAGLFMAIFELSKLVRGVGSGFVSLLIIIGGNILVLFLEGMVVGIQSLRLNYYEFFSKFFLNGKKVYKPLSV
ncbi:MAG: V-type ATPase 116kDa subunit family protein [Candidatus Omnitrophota bacterium]